MTSAAISRISSTVLVLGGAALLFASDWTLPLLALDLPPSATWLGELVGAGWLAMGALNWLSRGSVLGGIYGRPVVMANAAHYFITAMVLLRVAAETDGRDALWAVGALMLVLAAMYGWLLLRGPLRHDMPEPDRPPQPASPPLTTR